MSKSEYPTGVEKHGDSLHICFLYSGKRVRENLGVPDTTKNRKIAGELRASVCFSIRMGTFDYAERFPGSPNLCKFGFQSKEVTVNDLAKRWLDLKKLEISNNTLAGYESVIKNMLVLMGPKKFVSAVTQEDLLFIRKELLTGYQFIKKGKKKSLKEERPPL